MQACNKPVAIAASELIDLKQYEGRTFQTSKNGQVTRVKLEKVKRRDVYLSYVGQVERVDQFTVTQAKFREYYQLLPSSTAAAKAAQKA